MDEIYPRKDVLNPKIKISTIGKNEIVPMNIPDQKPRHIAQLNKSLISGCNSIKKERISLRIRPCFKIYVKPKEAKSNILATN